MSEQIPSHPQGPPVPPSATALDHFMDEVRGQYRTLESRNAKMRATLEVIAAAGRAGGYSGRDGVGYLRDLARKALEDIGVAEAQNRGTAP